MSVTTHKTNPIVEFRDALVKMTPELTNALPSHIKPERFQRVVMTVIQQSPELLQTDRRSLFASCLKCAADGLIPDGREAALVKYGDKTQYLPMFNGLQKRARNSGEIAGITAQVVYEGDEFIQTPDDFDKPLHHRPAPLGTARGKPIGAYAMTKLKDGTVIAEVMDVAEIEKVRASSRSGKNGPWVTWWDQMAKKTVFKRLSKWLPMDADVDAMIEHDNVVDHGPPTPVAEIATPTHEPDAFEAASAGIIDAEMIDNDPAHEVVS